MSTCYYLVRNKPEQIYEARRVAVGTGNGLSFVADEDSELWDGEGGTVAYRYKESTIGRPANLSDLRGMLSTGAYRLVDEYGDETDPDELEEEYGGAR